MNSERAIHDSPLTVSSSSTSRSSNPVQCMRTPLSFGSLPFHRLANNPKFPSFLLPPAPSFLLHPLTSYHFSTFFWDSAALALPYIPTKHFAVQVRLIDCTAPLGSSVFIQLPGIYFLDLLANPKFFLFLGHLRAWQGDSDPSGLVVPVPRGGYLFSWVYWLHVERTEPLIQGGSRWWLPRSVSATDRPAGFVTESLTGSGCVHGPRV